MTENKSSLTAFFIFLSILAILTFLIINPIKNAASNRNATRNYDINSILTAVQNYITENGRLPEGLSTTERQLGTCKLEGDKLCPDATTECLDLSRSLGEYLSKIPYDPKFGSQETTTYSIVVDENNIVTVKACKAEAGQKVEAYK